MTSYFLLRGVNKCWLRRLAMPLYLLLTEVTVTDTNSLEVSYFCRQLVSFYACQNTPNKTKRQAFHTLINKTIDELYFAALISFLHTATDVQTRQCQSVSR
jgi:hypothetical protein